MKSEQLLYCHLPTKYRICYENECLITDVMRGLSKSNCSQLINLENRHHYLPPGSRPVWFYMKACDISSALFQDELLKLVNADQIKHVTIISKFKFQQYMNFCSHMETKASDIKWDYYANSNEIVGTDLPCVILFGIPLVEHWASYISRARNKLIIVTGESFPRCY